MNSYAWDTAIVFIQNCGTNSTYSRQGRLSSSKLNTGKANDVQCHINDMAGNVREWTTEYSNYSGKPCMNRGGRHNGSDYYTASRNYGGSSGSNDNIAFRALLYIMN